MEKKFNGGSRNANPKILRATGLEISGNDVGGLVGGIVEKGFSDNQQTRHSGPSAAPRPSVLPFPVARHRSDGPHWAPKVGNLSIVDDNDDADEDVEEEEDFSVMELAADVARPVQRKEKKGIDFSRWQEIMKNDGDPMVHKKKKEMHSTEFEVGNKVKGKASDKSSSQFAGRNQPNLCSTSKVCHEEEQFMNMDDDSSTVFKEINGGTESQLDVGNESHSCEHSSNENIVRPVKGSQNGITEFEESTMADMEHEWQNGSGEDMQVDSDKQRMPKALTFSGFADPKFVVGEENSLESQIDAENRARLEKMSVHEIAEAQAEIMAKLNPELVNILKKRGKDKVKKQNIHCSDAATGTETDSMLPEKILSASNPSTGSTSSQKPGKNISGGVWSSKDDKATPDTLSQKCSTWDTWSRRVESVSNMRFSLDGNVINSDFSHVSETGASSSQSGYSADNVSERDFLRTEGDPGAAGYTIKEAVALTRSVVPGQRSLALHLIAAVLDRAVYAICRYQVGSTSTLLDGEGSIDWMAIWAFALGPVPELALSLRMCLDDNHNSVVLACAKTIQSVLSCDMNEIIFDVSEKTPAYSGDLCTAPVFRSKPDSNVGFLRGSFWKYNTKPSNILCFGEELPDRKAEGEHTIQDDITVAGQDIAAGLVRMGILPRICHLLEMDPSASLEECLLSILIAIARHSPTCAAAIMDCGTLVQTVASRFTSNVQIVSPSKIKTVTLLKLLTRPEKKNCLALIKNGIFRQVTWQMYTYPIYLDQWAKSGKEACKLSSSLLVEQLRLLKVFLHYGYCISDFFDLFASLCTWLKVPTIEKLIDNDVVSEYFAVANEAYLLLDVLARRLPKFFLHMRERMEVPAQNDDSFSWNQLCPFIDLAMQWIELKSIPSLSSFFDRQSKDGESRSLQDSEINSLLWVISSVLNMFSSVLKAVLPDDTMSFPDGHSLRLPDFAVRIGLEIIKNGYFSFSGCSDTFGNDLLPENHSIVEYLCQLRLKVGQELAISSTCCLQGLFQVVASVDRLIQLGNLKITNSPSQYQKISTEDKILANGILKSCVVEVRVLLTMLMKLITKEWQCMQRVEMFGRGGPTPGVGVGWGASGGGYWSLEALLAQQDARLLVHLLEIYEMPIPRDPLEAADIDYAMQRLNCALAACSIMLPGNGYVIDNLLKVIFRVPVIKYLDFAIRKSLSLRKGFNSFKWDYKEEDFSLFASMLSTHFRSRWLSVKKKQKPERDTGHATCKSKKKDGRSLETIHEDTDVSNAAGEESSSLRLEWAYQRLPFPEHWFLSAISTVHYEKNACPPGASYRETFADLPSHFVEVAKGGLFFLLGIEAIPTFIASGSYPPVGYIPVVWKLHAMSIILLSGMAVLEDEKSRDIYETLQNIYGEFLDEKRLPNLQFESDIHGNYTTFVETLVDQFAAVSYGDMLFGRQVAMYLHRSVEASVRLATWNALSNARALELLPPLHQCLAKAEGYLEPIENNERILEAYVKSWVSGALDKAANRNSVAFSMALHHLSSFIFGNIVGEMLSLRNKLARSLLRDYSQKQQHEGMVVKLICYNNTASQAGSDGGSSSSLPVSEIENRLQLLKEIYRGQGIDMQKLEPRIRREFPARTHLS